MNTTLQSGERARIVFRHILSPRYRETDAGRVKIEYPQHGGPPQAVTECAIITGAKENQTVLAAGEARCAWVDENPHLTPNEADLIAALREAASIASGRPRYGSDLERFVAIRLVCDQAASVLLDTPPRPEPYEKEIGRQHSLMRAVEQLEHADRNAVLQAYFERPRRHPQNQNQFKCVCGEVLHSAAEALAHFTGHQEWQKPKQP